MTGILNLLLGAGGVIKDTYFNLVSLLLPGNGTNGAQNNTFLDSSTNNFTITRNGNTTQGTFSPFSQTGWGNYFDGTGDNLALPSSSNLAVGTGDFCVEAWVYWTATGVLDAIYSNLVNSAGGDAQLNVQLTTGNKVQVTGWSTTFLTGATSVASNTWNHIAVCRSGATLSIFLNGTRDATTTSSNNWSSTNAFYIGDYPVGGATFSGYISNLRVVKGSTPYDATSSSLTVPTTPLTAITNTQLLTCQSNRFRDNSSNAFAITANGNTSVVAFSPFAPTAAYTTAAVGGSGYFDGTGDYLTAPNNTALDLSTGDFTIECWFYPTSFAALLPLVYRYNGNYSTGADFQFGIAVTTTGSVTVRPYQGTTDYTLTAGTAVLNTWNHIAFVRTGNTFWGFVNGNRSASSQTVTGALNNSTWATTVGAILSTTGGNNFATGYIADTRILKGTALYTASTYTVPTAPLTAITNTSLLLNFTNAGITDATAKNDLETVGNAQISTSVSKFGGGSIAFDGTGDYLLMPSSQLNAFGTGDFTIEMWFYLNNTSAIQALYDSRPASTDGAYSFIYVNAGGTAIIYDVSAATRITGTATVSTSTWHHFAISRYVGSTRMFFNGNQVGSTYTDSTNYLVGTSRPAIGSSGFSLGTYPLNGYIDDLRVTRYARYVEGTGGNVGKMVFNGTNTLALPTAPFPVQ